MSIELDRSAIAQVQIRVVCPRCKGKKYFVAEDDVLGEVEKNCLWCEGSGWKYEWISVEKLFELLP